MDYAVDTWDGTTPLPSLYAKTAGDAINIWTCWIKGCYVHMRWGQVNGTMQEGSYVCTPKNCGRANATSAEEQARLEAISRWKKQLKRKYYMSEEAAQTVFKHKPMLAKVFKDVKRITYPASLQPKYDGLRCTAERQDGKVVLHSRGGDAYTVVHIQEELEKYLPEGLMLDGELYRHNTPLQTLNSWVRRPQMDSLLLEYHVYDCVPLGQTELTWLERKAVLDTWFTTLPKYTDIYPVNTWEVQNAEEIKTKHDELVQCGYEGAIVRLFHGKYRFGYRSSELLKVKEFQDAEFKIVGWKQKKIRLNDEGVEIVTPCFICVTAEGKQFDVVPKGTHEERRRFFEEASTHVGKDVTVRYFNWTPEGLPFLPVGIAIREPGT